MPTEIAVQDINFRELERALKMAPMLVARNVKGEMLRFARRVRRKTIRERMSGPPGINGGQFKKGKHINARVIGNDLASLKAINSLSRILRVHEEGAIIMPRAGEWLYLSKKTAASKKKSYFGPNEKSTHTIFARVKRVIIPARLGHETIWRRELPDGIERINAGVERAMKEAITTQMNAMTQFITGVIE